MKVGCKFNFIFLMFFFYSYHSAYKFKKLEEIDYLMYQSRVVLPIKQHYPSVDLSEFQQLANNLIKKIHKNNLYLESKNNELVQEDDDFLNDLSDSEEEKGKEEEETISNDEEEGDDDDLEKLLEEAWEEEE